MTQVSRFDPLKDPLGVIDVYRLTKKQIPSVQLLLVASMAKDDLGGWAYYESPRVTQATIMTYIC
jgi:trehalose synthase